MTTPSGTTLEGTGVAPDAVVLRTKIDVAAGRDPVVAAARTWLDAQRRRVASSGTVDPLKR